MIPLRYILWTLAHLQSNDHTSPAKESLDWPNRQRRNYEWPPYFNYLNWSDRQILSPRRLHNLRITWQNVRISSVTCRMSVKIQHETAVREFAGVLPAPSCLLHRDLCFQRCFPSVFAGELANNWEGFKNTCYGATVFSVLDSRSKLVTFTQALHAQLPSLSSARKIEWRCCRSLYPFIL